MDGALFICDLKAINILVGLQSHSSTFPCPFCYFRKGDRSGNVCVPRTFEQVRRYHAEWLLSGGKKQDLKVYFNCQSRPILESLVGDVLSVFPPAPLHVLTGVTKHVVDKMEDIAEEPVKEWQHSLGVKKHIMFGGSFVGNDARKMLSHAEDLEQFCDESQWVQLAPYMQVLLDFDSVIRCCFGRRLFPGTEDRIAAFKTSFLKTDLSVTSKVHCVLNHLHEYTRRTGRGLALDSEQTHESVHADFNKLWRSRGYYARASNGLHCKKNLLKAVLDYNSGNL